MNPKTYLCAKTIYCLNLLLALHAAKYGSVLASLAFVWDPWELKGVIGSEIRNVTEKFLQSSVFWHQTYDLPEYLLSRLCSLQQSEEN
uniref:Uncharacterized protein LOC105139634 n=1 Tax=Rhizophora mucronata TaxID=61149 RepID=A0A2P2KLN4_RHIMU